MTAHESPELNSNSDWTFLQFQKALAWGAQREEKRERERKGERKEEEEKTKAGFGYLGSEQALGLMWSRWDKIDTDEK